MANDVFANTREISCKKADGKGLCCFPDVCMTPPTTPATPAGVPIPYPNTAFAKDTANGSKTVKISDQEIMLKNKSYFKTSTGDEAGCATPAKKGIITGKIKGKLYFTSWSMDVKAEGKNVVRHLDIATHNHASLPGNTLPWVHLDTMSISPPDHPCEEEINTARQACKGAKTTGSGKTASRDCSSCKGNCKEKMACILVPKGKDKELCCSPGNTGHHMIEDHWTKGNNAFSVAQGNSGYNAAPTVCVEGGRFEKEHGEMHIVQGLKEESFMNGGENSDQSWDYGQGKSATLIAHDMTFGNSGCSKTCMESQLDDFYGNDNDRVLNTPKIQSLAKNDPSGDGRWLRGNAENSLKGLLKTS